MPQRLGRALLTLLAAIAISLAAAGVYGLTACVVARAEKDIGIRRALGATALDVAGMIAKTALWPILGGIAAGSHSVTLEKMDDLTVTDGNDRFELSDAAYTLKVGRTVFRHRRVLVCRGREDAIAALESPHSSRLLTAADTDEPRDRPVVDGRVCGGAPLPGRWRLLRDVRRSLEHELELRHDGALSILRSFKAEELVHLGEAAGLRNLLVEHHFPARLVLSA